jgi:AcrR family transcriptional regulator
VIDAATAQYIRGERVDLTIIARELGVSRATIYRWFGSREGLLGEVIAIELEQLIVRKRAAVRRRGGRGLFEQEPTMARRVLTSSGAVVQPRAVAAITNLITDEVVTGGYVAPIDPSTLAYAIVRLAEAFLYNDAAVGVRGDHGRLRDVEAALLGVPLDRR